MWLIPLGEDDALLNKPEAGMGFQIVKASLDGNVKIVFVFNAELALSVEEMFQVRGQSPAEIRSGARAPRDFTVVEHLTIEDFEIQTAQAVRAWPPDTLLWSRGAGAGVVTVPSALAPTPVVTNQTKPGDGFVRFSAFVNDKRILSNGEVSAGAYATTIADARFAVTGLAAAGRYALPNPSPAVFVFTIVPSSPAPYQAGTVRPAFLQAGGGVEVFFSAGCAAGSAFRPYEIPTT